METKENQSTNAILFAFRIPILANWRSYPNHKTFRRKYGRKEEISNIPHLRNLHRICRSHKKHFILGKAFYGEGHIFGVDKRVGNLSGIPHPEPGWILVWILHCLYIPALIALIREKKKGGSERGLVGVLE